MVTALRNVGLLFFLFFLQKSVTLFGLFSILDMNKKNRKKRVVQDKTLKKNSKKLYISFTERFICYFLLFFVFFGLGIYFIIHSTDITKEQVLSYKSVGDIDYTVCLKENELIQEAIMIKK